MLKIKHLNFKGHEVEAIISEKMIIGFNEVEVDNVELFDAEGNSVGEQERENVYHIFFENGNMLTVTKETYDKLVARLKVENL